jgi:glycosyltransferase involved in cell wall biosynthesis
VRFSIVTPSYRNSDWLKLCIASVADQQVEAEHIVQDAGSDDGTLSWLPNDSRVKAFVERDSGMYDALNRGFGRSSGEILAWLNCDEQYLPGALKTVEEYFRDHPGTEIVFGDILMADREGNYLFHRKVQTPLKYHTWTCHLSTLSCAMFFRRRLFFEGAYRFRPDWRDAADGEWMVRLLRDRIRMGTIGGFTSVFTCTGANMSRGANARRENRELFRTAPVWARWLSPAFVLQHRLRRWLGGMYRQAPFGFELYTLASPARRVLRQVAQPQCRLPGGLYTR